MEGQQLSSWTRLTTLILCSDWRTQRSNKPDLLELSFHDLLVEWLHDVLVGSGVQRTCNMRDIVFGGAEHHFRTVASRQPTKRAQEVVAVHLRHIPIEQNSLRQLLPARFERLLAVLCFQDLEIEPFQNSPRHLSNDAGVVNDQTRFHRTASLGSPVIFISSTSNRVKPRLPSLRCRARDRHR